MNNRMPDIARVEFSKVDDARTALEKFFTGSSEILVEWLSARVSLPNSAFEMAAIAEDLELLEELKVPAV
jgi:hypothetical protein